MIDRGIQGVNIPDNSTPRLAGLRQVLGPGVRTRAALAATVVVTVMGSLVMIARAQGGPGRPQLTVAAGRQAPAPPTATVSPTPTVSPTATPSPSVSATVPAPEVARPSATAPTTPSVPPPAAKVVAAPPPAKPAVPVARAPAPPPQPSGLSAYNGLGAWVSLYDFALSNAPIDPAQATAAMAARGVQTLYLQTTRWNLPDDITGAAETAKFIEDAHAHGIKVIGWYLPGFADINLDVHRSVAVLKFTTPKGQHFDGLAPDIEDKSAVNHNVAAFDAGIVAYSRALRAAVGSGVALGAIVPDAVNNRRYPQGWVGFPWQEIGHDYDVILPMGYWSVTKSSCAQQYDAGGYTRDVASTTTSLMGVTKPLVIVGGVGDCDTVAEVQAYVAAAKAVGVGASIYSFETVERNAGSTAMWKALQTAIRH